MNHRTINARVILVGISYRKLARRLGVDHAWVHRVLNGKKVSAPLLRRISDELDQIEAERETECLS